MIVKKIGKLLQVKFEVGNPFDVHVIDFDRQTRIFILEHMLLDELVKGEREESKILGLLDFIESERETAKASLENGVLVVGKTWRDKLPRLVFPD